MEGILFEAIDGNDLQSINKLGTGNPIEKRTQMEKSKSKAIREYKTQNPDVGPKEIAKSLNEIGYNVTAQFVSTVLSNDRRKAGVASVRVQRNSGGFTAEDLMAVKGLVQQVGSIEAAKQAIDMYSQLLH